MRKRDKRIEQPCYPSCRSRMNSICIKLPVIGLVSDTVYHLKDPGDPLSGEYVDHSSIPTQTPHICPFSKPRRAINGKLRDSGFEEQEHRAEEGEVIEETAPTEQPKPLNIRQVIKKGLRSPAGITLAATYGAIGLFYGTKQLLNYFEAEPPDLNQLVTDLYQYIEPWINS